ncbi:MAG: hypothetical protein ACO20H_06890 [Bacteriovoracaceae bacterium]
MKLIKLLMISQFALFSAQASLPESWYSDADEVFDKSNDLSDANYTLDNILDAKTEVVEAMDKRKAHKSDRQRWFLQSIKTEIGVENIGTWGVVGLKGETAVEFIWTRTKESIKRLQQKFYDTTKSTPVEDKVEVSIEGPVLKISEEMSADDLSQKIEPLAELAFKSGKVNNKSKFKKNLLKHAKEFQKVINSITSASHKRPWWVYKYQLHLEAEASGKVYPFINVGAGFRLKLEWYRAQRKVQNSRARELLTGQGVKSENARFIYAMAKDFETLKPLTLKKRSYGLDYIKVGVGLSASGKIVVASAKGMVMGSLFFKRDPQPVNKSDEEEISLQDSFPILSHANDKNLSYAKEHGVKFSYDSNNEKSFENSTVARALFEGSRKSFRKGLKKATKMATFWSRGALRRLDRRIKKGKTVNFDLEVLELELELYLRGNLSMARIEGIAAVELFLVKRN